MNPLSRVLRWVRRPRPSSKRPAAYQPKIELLEDRTTPTTFTVTSSANAGAGSLRQAILDANASAGHDVIRFSATVVSPIRPTSSLPSITSPVTMDGARVFFGIFQVRNPSGRPLIEIDGSLAGNTTEGLLLDDGASGSVIKGLVINRFDDDGIAIRADGVTIQNCWIGTTFDGTGDAGNDAAGIRVINGASGIVLGGLAAGQRNVISGNAVGIGHGGTGMVNTLIQGNFIGTNVAGNAAVPNNFGILILGVSTGNQIDGNVISGNSTAGITLGGSLVAGNVVRSNRIGVAANGASPLGNGKFGVLIANGAHDNEIGLTGAGNTIAFNGQRGVLIGSDPTNPVLANPAGVGNTVLSNVFFGQPISIDLGPNDATTFNDSLDADTGPNNLQNFAILASAVNVNGTTFVQGSLNSNPNSSYFIQLFASTSLDANGLPLNMFLVGATLVGSDAAGNLSFNVATGAQAVGTRMFAVVTNNATGDTSEFSNAVDVADTPPMIRNDTLTPLINEGQKATLTGQLVDPDPGDVLTLLVNWGDGSAVQEYQPGLDPFAVKHRYDDDGTYNVQFTWTDNHGRGNTRVRQVVVRNVFPDISHAVAVPVPFLDQALLFGKFTDPGQDTITLTVNWGDGEVETFQLGDERTFSVRHSYQHSGRFTIQLTLMDDEGGLDTMTRTLFVP